MAIGLAEAGADVVLVDRQEATETAGVIHSRGRKTLTFAADLMSIEPIPLIVQKTVETFGKIDILINNAGTIRRTPAIDYSEKDWDDIMAVNAKTVFFFSQAVARDMMKRKSGKIINIASLLAFQGGIIVPAYAASKGAVAQITKALANEWAAHGININAIAPGYMATDNTKALREDPVRSKAILDRIPAGRWGTPQDLAGVAVFLASPASDYVNGHILVVDGGWLAR
jgi:2-deoxy-D-gluconate 3-dehydrogenase